MDESEDETDGASERNARHAHRLRDQDDLVVVSWNGPHDPQDPFNWPVRKKWTVVGLGLFACFFCAMNGAILSVAHNEINEDFGISDATFPFSYFATTSWGIGGALFPLIFLPLTEDFGIMPVFFSAYAGLIVFLIPVGFAKNYATLIVVRFFSGGCVQLLCNCVGGIASNVFEGDRARSMPINLYVTLYLAGTSMGPVVGSSILQHLSWRWIGHIEVIWTVALLPLYIFGMSESRGSVVLASRAKRLRREGKEAFTEHELGRKPTFNLISESIRRPLSMLLTEPVVLVSATWSAFSLGLIYLFTQAVEQVFAELYDWNAVQAGYVQVAIVIGELLGIGLSIASDYWYYASARRNVEAPGSPIPEARLYGSIIGGFLGVTGGMLVYGWTSYSYIPWIVPTIGLSMVGVGSTAVVVSIASYVVDAYSKYAASAIGAVLFMENTFIAFLPLAASAMYSNLGLHWASSLLAFLSLGLVATPFIVLIWGKQIRARSPLMKDATIERGVSVATDAGRQA